MIKEVKEMMIGKKMRVLPTKEQEILFRKSCGVARWAYNYYLGEKQRVYNEWKEDKTNSNRRTRRFI